VSASAGTTRPSDDRVLTLDGVRGLAVLIVIIHNSAWIAGESRLFVLKLANAVNATGWIGVQLFFVLSGFLITGILLDTKGTPHFFRSFYLRRILRIFPLYYVVVMLVIVIAPLLAWSPAWADAIRQSHRWAYWLYLQNWITTSPGIDALSHTWSLAVEEQFYLLWPLVVWFTSRRGLTALCLVTLVVTPFIRLGLRVAGMDQSVAYVFTIARWDALAAGAVVAILVRREGGRALLARWQGRIAAVAGVALAGLVAAERGFHSFDLWVQVIGQTLIAVLSACLIGYAVEEGPKAPQRLQAFLSTPWLRTLGKYSYAMYLLHQPIQQLLTPLLGEVVRGPDTPWRLLRLALYVLLVLVLTFAGALLSWRLVEKPFLDLKDRIAPRYSARSTAPLR
jgi:peptidoglycan/LPS O-acetylase OafA/YrhL